MGPAPVEPPGLPPKQRKVKTYKVLGDVGEFQERLASTLPPPKAPPPPDVFSIQDASEFPPDVWFAATISPDNGVAVISSYRELCKARALYQQQLNNIHTARKLHGMGGSATLLSGPAPGTLTLNPGPGPGPGLTAGPSALPPSLLGGAGPGDPLVNRTIAETLRLGAETRRLGKFELQQQKWDEVTATLATRVGRAPQELAMQRGPAWRTRAELTELLYRAQPRDARGLNPDEVFLTSLRDAWERVIPLGSIFSGLALHLKDKPHELPDTRATRVGRPLDPLVPAAAATALLRSQTQRQQLLLQQTAGQQTSRQEPSGAQQQQQQQSGEQQQLQHGTSAALLASSGVLLGKPPLGRSLSARGRAWEDSELLKQRVAEYGKRLRTLAPHDPDFGSLVVAGEALEGQLEALATAPISLAEVEAHVREHHPAAYEAYKAVKDEMETQLRAALEAEEAQRAAVEADARARAPRPGPHVAVSRQLLSLGCHAGKTSHGSVTLTCGGTAAVWWAWQRRPAAQPPHAATELGQPRRFVASQQSGVLLPGQSLELTITFAATTPGTFREVWELVTRPPLHGPSPTLTLHLRGVAEVRDSSSVGRAALGAQLAQREKMAKVAAALERVLRDVRMPRRPQPPEPPEEVAAADAWDKANGCSLPPPPAAPPPAAAAPAADAAAVVPYAWPPLFYAPSLQSELAEVYREANAALTAALTPVVEEDPKKKRKETAGHRRGKPAEEPPPPQPKYPLAWDPPSLTTLDALLADLAAAAPAVAAPLAVRADAAKARARVPPNSRRVLRRAMRVLVCKMVDVVGEKLGGIRAELEAKAAEAATEAAAAAAEHSGGDADGGGGGGFEPELSTTSVLTTHPSGGGKGSGGGAKAAGGKGGKGHDAKGHDTKAAGGKGARNSQGHVSTGDGASGGGGAAGAAAAAAAAAAALPGVEHIQPAFHEKAVTATRAVVKASLNSIIDEVLRHKVAVGDALEESIRDIDQRVEAEQRRALAAAGIAPQASAAVEGDRPIVPAAPPADSGAPGVGGAVEWFAPPAGGVPAPRPGAAAGVRSPALEQLYWERLGVLRTWTSLVIPNRGDIR